MPDPIPCQLISWTRFQRLARTLALNIHDAGFRPDLIVAIARGGLAPARVLADYLDVMNVAAVRVEHYHGSAKEPRARIRQPLYEDVAGRKVLIVDDVSDTGDTFELTLAHVRERLPDAQIRTAVLHHKVVSAYVPDFHAARVVKWRWLIYPWAVIEDISGFVRAMAPYPDDADAVVRTLRATHGVQVPVQVVRDVLHLLGTSPVAERAGLPAQGPR